jgi:solute carrier family 44 (choline transporter-like protein), member 2/4/5
LGALAVVGLICFAFCCCIACNFDSLKKAIDVIDAAADFLAGTKRIILVPAVFFFFSLVAISIWMGAMACVLSLNHISPSQYIPQGRDLEWKEEVQWMALYMLFGILWITAFFEYCSTFVVMVSASSYYFNSGPEFEEPEGSAEVGAGFKYAFLHQGSIAIGSFIIALIRFIRIVFMYLAREAEKQSGDNAAVKAIVRCAECLLALLEKICDYINSSAYAY